MQDGQLKEKGAHHELMNLNGKYKEMYLKTTNTSGKEIACQTVPEGKEHEEVELNKTVEEKKDTKSTDENKEE